MSVVKAESSAEESVAVVSAVEGEIRDLVRKDIVGGRKTKSEPAGDIGSEGLTSLIGRVAVTSVNEIDSLISELREVREFLKSEGERVQREINHYAQINQTALASVKIITDAIGPWKSTAFDRRSRFA